MRASPLLEWADVCMHVVFTEVGLSCVLILMQEPPSLTSKPRSAGQELHRKDSRITNKKKKIDVSDNKRIPSRTEVVLSCMC